MKRIFLIFALMFLICGQIVCAQIKLSAKVTDTSGQALETMVILICVEIIYFVIQNFNNNFVLKR